ncbi:MAG: hypothetical protein HYX20_02745 [Candidatus Yanofskybacteria bacterium]|nr:hypothetical protein [Candidatus Yanofskybacteria bacterium]
MPNLTATIRGVVGQVLAVLSTRNKDVISRRFGLKTGKKETLESIGKSYGITRERVRQIEEVSLKQIRGNLNDGIAAKVKPFVSLAENILEQAGGVSREDNLFAKFSGVAKENPANAALVFFLFLDERLKKFAETDDLHAYWALSDQHAEYFKKSLSIFMNVLEKENAPIAESAVVDFYKKSGASLKDVTPAIVASYLSISQNIAKNNFGQIGLANWSDIKPRGVRDKAFLVLKRDGKPKHFREITRLINVSGFDNRRANVQTVHNELIKDKRFVLVGRGLYGLADWGYKAGTVKDVITDLLHSAGQPMHKKEIVSQVLSHRMVKENTILLNLQDSKTFDKKGNGIYALKEA